MTIRSLTSISALWFAMGSIDAGAAEEVNRFQPRQATIRDLGPNLSDSEWYKEEWNYNAWMEDGHMVAVDFIISNIGIGDHKGVFKARIDKPDGKRIKCQLELDSDEWKYDKQKYALDFRKGKAIGDLSSQQVTVRCKELKMDLTFRNLDQAYRPGALRFGDQGRYIKFFPMPRARMVGRVQHNDQVLDLDGPGMVIHSLSDAPPHKYAKRWFRFKLVNTNHTIILAELETPKEFDSVQRGWAMIYNAEQKLIASTQVNFQHDGFIQAKNKEGYPIPRRVRFQAVDGSSSLSGYVLMKAIDKVNDPTERLNFALRAIVRRYTKPMDFTIGCHYKVRVAGQSGEQVLEGEGSYRFVYVNPTR